MGNRIRAAIVGTLTGIGIAMTIFSVVLAVIEMVNHGSIGFQSYGLSRMVLGAAVIGVGFGLPAGILYYGDRLPLGVASIIQMSIGCAIMLVVGYATGMMGAKDDPKQVVVAALFMVGVAMLVWVAMMLYQRAEARKLNERIQQEQRRS